MHDIPTTAEREKQEEIARAETTLSQLQALIPSQKEYLIHLNTSIAQLKNRKDGISNEQKQQQEQIQKDMIKWSLKETTYSL